MPSPILVDDLVNQVRDQTDEFSEVNITDADILQSLNRGQSYAVDIMSRHYEDPFIQYSSLTLTSGVSEYDMPEDVFEDRLQRVEIVTDNVTYSCQRITYRDVHRYESSTSTNIPAAYTVFGRTIKFYNTPSGTYNARLWTMREPETLVLSQGRIDYIDTSSGLLSVDSIGTDLTTSLTALKCFINVVDAQTGEVRGTYQIANIDGNNITIKSGGLNRSTIHNKTVGTTLASTINQDDYVCLATGTCVPFMRNPLTNFLVQYGTADIRRRVQDNADMEQRVLRDFEKQVERQWAGREAQQRVARKSSKWIDRLFRPFPRGY